MLLWDSTKCVRCMRCAGTCPVHAIGEGLAIDREICDSCNICDARNAGDARNTSNVCSSSSVGKSCVSACPQRALSMDSRRYTLDETMAFLLQDRPFYEESGGGVTLSGGEALVQWEFSVALLEALRKEGIHTALESSGLASPAVFREVLRFVDLLLFDLKHYDEKTHIEGTGAHNASILSNFKSALDSGVTVLPRIPVIPGYNNRNEDARGFVRLLASFGINRVQLLPFHQFGERKYELLSIPYALKGIPQLHQEDLAEYRQIFLDSGIDCVVL